MATTNVPVVGAAPEMQGGPGAQAQGRRAWRPPPPRRSACPPVAELAAEALDANRANR